MGQYEQAFQHMERGLALYDRAAHEQLSVEYGVHDARACALYESALALWNMGFIEQARGKLDASLAHSHQLTLRPISPTHSHTPDSSFTCSATRSAPNLCREGAADQH